MVTADLSSSAKQRDATKARCEEILEPFSKFTLFHPISVCQLL